MSDWQILFERAPWFFIGWGFIFGAIVGSFLNVVIARLPWGRSIVWPPSHCMSCGAGVKPFHNVPVLSWFMLGGRCANCKAPFSIRYALVELAFGLFCAAAVARHGVSLATLTEITFVGLLLCLALIDLDHWILPHVLTRSGIVLGLLFSLAYGKQNFLVHLFAAAAGLSGLMLIAFVAERIAGQEALGGGDPWLLAMLGAFLGLHALLPIVLLSSMQGALIGGALLLLKGKKGEGEEPAPVQGSALAADEGEELWIPPPTAIPFGPFLALAGVELLYFPALRHLFPF